MHPSCPLLRSTGPDLLESRDVPSAAVDRLPVVPVYDADVVANLRHIVAHGQALGRNPDAFMKVGDSNTATPGYLTRLGEPGYDPTAAGLTAGYPELEATRERYLAPIPAGGNSFTEASSAATGGWTVFNALPAVPGELAATNASVALITLGSNDQVLESPDVFRAGLTALVNQLAAAGVVPLLSTIPAIAPGYGRNGVIEQFGRVVADVAAANQLPVLNLYRAQVALPNYGLDETDARLILSPESGVTVGGNTPGIHLATSPNGGGFFRPADLASGQNTRNLITLEALNWLDANVIDPPPAVPPPPPWRPIPAGRAVFAVGSPAGQPPVVRVFDAGSGRQIDQFTAYEPTFLGGVQVAVGDVTGDGVPDFAVAPGPGGGPVVKAFSGADGSQLFSVFAFEPADRKGVTVAVGDVDGSGRAAVVVGSGPGGGPRVRVYHPGTGTFGADFYAYEPTFRGGVNVAVGKFASGPGIVVGAGEGGGPVVEVFDGATGTPLSAFAAYDPSLRGGVRVAAGNVAGTGTDDIVTGAGEGGSPNVREFDSNGNLRHSFEAGDPMAADGVRVAVVRTAAGGPAPIVTAAASGRAHPVSVFNSTGTLTAMASSFPDSPEGLTPSVGG